MAAQGVDQGLGSVLGQVLGDLEALDEVEAASEVEGAGQVDGAEAVARDAQVGGVDVVAVDALVVANPLSAQACSQAPWPQPKSATLPMSSRSWSRGTTTRALSSEPWLIEV